jgi:hypothetical protein
MVATDDVDLGEGVRGRADGSEGAPAGEREAEPAGTPRSGAVGVSLGHRTAAKPTMTSTTSAATIGATSQGSRSAGPSQRSDSADCGSCFTKCS